MQKILAPMVLLFALVLGGGTADANLPKCNLFCDCSFSCTSPCNHNGVNTTCAAIGVCVGGSQCHHASPLTLALAAPKPERPVCTADDDPFASTSTDDCLPTDSRVTAERPPLRASR